MKTAMMRCVWCGGVVYVCGVGGVEYHSRIHAGGCQSAPAISKLFANAVQLPETPVVPEITCESGRQLRGVPQGATPPSAT